MNMKLKMAALLLPCVLLAGPSFAQSSATKAEDYAKDKVVEEVKDKAMTKGEDMAKDAVKDVTANEAEKMSAPADAMIKSDPAVVETPAITPPAKDGMMIKGKEIASDHIIHKSGMKDAPVEAAPVQEPVNITTPAPAPAIPNIACPAGTTAQPDGTCMITGDYRG